MTLLMPYTEAGQYQTRHEPTNRYGYDRQNTTNEDPTNSRSYPLNLFPHSLPIFEPQQTSRYWANEPPDTFPGFQGRATDLRTGHYPFYGQPFHNTPYPSYHNPIPDQMLRDNPLQRPRWVDNLRNPKKKKTPKNPYEPVPIMGALPLSSNPWVGGDDPLVDVGMPFGRPPRDLLIPMDPWSSKSRTEAMRLAEELAAPAEAMETTSLDEGAYQPGNLPYGTTSQYGYQPPSHPRPAFYPHSVPYPGEATEVQEDVAPVEQGGQPTNGYPYFPSRLASEHSNQSGIELAMNLPYAEPETEFSFQPPMDERIQTHSSYIRPPVPPDTRPSHPSQPYDHYPSLPNSNLPPPDAAPPTPSFLSRLGKHASGAFHFLLSSSSNAVQQTYLHLLLRIPHLYYRHLAQVFVAASICKEDIERLKISSDYGVLEMSGADGPRLFHYPALMRFKTRWDECIDIMVREWQVQNVVAVLLLGAVASMLTMDSVEQDPVTRTTALLSLVCALTSLSYGCIYQAQFDAMKKLYKAASWAEEIQRSQTNLFWNVWIFLAMPTVWLLWSILAFVASIVSYTWRTGFTGEDRKPLPPTQALGPRLAVTAALALSLVYFILILRVLVRFGVDAEEKWTEMFYSRWKKQKKPKRPSGYDANADLKPPGVGMFNPGMTGYFAKQGHPDPVTQAFGDMQPQPQRADDDYWTQSPVVVDQWDQGLEDPILPATSSERVDFDPSSTSCYRFLAEPAQWVFIPPAMVPPSPSVDGSGELLAQQSTPSSSPNVSKSESGQPENAPLREPSRETSKRPQLPESPAPDVPIDMSTVPRSPSSTASSQAEATAGEEEGVSSRLNQFLQLVQSFGHSSFPTSNDELPDERESNLPPKPPLFSLTSQDAASTSGFATAAGLWEILVQKDLNLNSTSHLQRPRARSLSNVLLEPQQSKEQQRSNNLHPGRSDRPRSRQASQPDLHYERTETGPPHLDLSAKRYPVELHDQPKARDRTSPRSCYVETLAKHPHLVPKLFELEVSQPEISAAERMREEVRILAFSTDNSYLPYVADVADMPDLGFSSEHWEKLFKDLSAVLRGELPVPGVGVQRRLERREEIFVDVVSCYNERAFVGRGLELYMSKRTASDDLMEQKTGTGRSVFCTVKLRRLARDTSASSAS